METPPACTTGLEQSTEGLRFPLLVWGSQSEELSYHAVGKYFGGEVEKRTFHDRLQPKIVKFQKRVQD